MKNLLFGSIFLTIVATSCDTKPNDTATATSSVAPKSKADSVAWAAAHYVVNRDSAFDDPRTALTDLINGNRRFVEEKRIEPDQDLKTVYALAAGQKPFAIVVSCSDSRVPDELLFDQGFGDLFCIRAAGQVLSAPALASIEYATLNLGSKLVVVMGHSACGAVKAAIDNAANPPGNIGSLVKGIQPAVVATKKMSGDKVANVAKQNVLNQVETLRKTDPVLSKQFAEGAIWIVGAVYDLSSGKVEFLPETMANLPKPKATALPAHH